MRKAYSKAVSSHCKNRPPSPKWPLVMLVLRIIEREQEVHVTSLALATHFAASHTPTLKEKKNEIISYKKKNFLNMEKLWR